LARLLQQADRRIFKPAPNLGDFQQLNYLQITFGVRSRSMCIALTSRPRRGQDARTTGKLSINRLMSLFSLRALISIEELPGILHMVLHEQRKSMFTLYLPYS
jgi:hypothetical protein